MKIILNYTLALCVIMCYLEYMMNEEKNKTLTFSIRISAELNEKIMQRAEKEDRSRNYIIMRALDQFLLKS